MASTWSFAALLLVAASGCADVGDAGLTEEVAAAEDEIVGGSTDNGDPAVVMLRDASGNGFCTGTLVTPTVVLTAAHCIENDPPASIGFGKKGNQRVVAVKASHMNPAYDPEDFTGGGDVGVLILKKAVTHTHPVLVNLEASGVPRPGRSVRIVGFGDNDGAGEGSGFGTKRKARATVTPIVPEDGLIDGEFIKIGSPELNDPEDAQKCNGDSGGPTFYKGADGKERIVSVSSFGLPGCREGGIDTRTDVHAAFLQPFLCD
jgi:hypothetical protein